DQGQALRPAADEATELLLLHPTETGQSPFNLWVGMWVGTGNTVHNPAKSGISQDSAADPLSAAPYFSNLVGQERGDHLAHLQERCRGHGDHPGGLAMAALVRALTALAEARVSSVELSLPSAGAVLEQLAPRPPMRHLLRRYPPEPHAALGNRRWL